MDAPTRRRRFSAAPARQNQIRSGETFVRVFQNMPLGLAVLQNHRIGEVVKHQQGDLAGVQVGDTILEVNNQRVDAYKAGDEVALQIRRSQIQRGRCRIRFFRPLTSIDRRLNKYHNPGASDLAARQKVKRSGMASSTTTTTETDADTDTPSRPGNRRRGSLVWQDEDATLGKRKGSVESVYAVDNLDQLVGDIEEFEHHADLDLPECVTALKKEIDNVISDQQRRSGRTLFSTFPRHPPEPNHYKRKIVGNEHSSIKVSTAGPIEKLWSRLANICELDPDEGELRPVFRHLKIWRQMMVAMLDNVGRDRIMFARKPPSRAKDILAASDCPWFFSILSEQNWEELLFSHSVATEKLPLTATASKKTRDLLEPLIPALLLITEPVETVYGGDAHAPHPVTRLGAQWISPACTLLSRLVRFDVNGIPCASEFDTGMLVEMLRSNLPRVSSVVFQTLARRAQISCARRPLGTIFGHDWEGSALCKVGSTGFVGCDIPPVTMEGHVYFFTLDGDVLRQFPQLWHQYKGGGRTAGSAAARGFNVAGVVCLRTWCLRGCILKSIDPAKPEEGFVLLSRVGAANGAGVGEVYVDTAAENWEGEPDPEGRIPLLSMKVHNRPRETEGWFIAIGKAITASGNSAGSEGGVGSLLSLHKSTSGADRVLQERNNFGTYGYNLATFNSSDRSDSAVGGRATRSSSQSELPEPIECSIPVSDSEDDEDGKELSSDGDNRHPSHGKISEKRASSASESRKTKLQQQPVHQWREELTSRAARILAKNSSTNGVGDIGLELMAPMFNMLAAGSRKLEQGQLSEDEFATMLKKAEQYSEALEQEVRPESKTTASHTLPSKQASSAYSKPILSSRQRSLTDPISSFYGMSTGASKQSVILPREKYSPQMRAKALQKHLRQQQKRKEIGESSFGWIGKKGKSKHSISNNTLNVYLPCTLDSHYFREIVTSFGRKKSVGDKAQSDVERTVKSPGSAEDPHLGGILLPSMTKKGLKECKRHPHYKEFGVLTNILWFQKWFAKETENLFSRNCESFAKLDTPEMASLVHCARMIVYACVNVSATWLPVSESTLSERSGDIMQEHSSASPSAVATSKMMNSLIAAAVAASRCLALLKIFKEENDLAYAERDSSSSLLQSAQLPSQAEMFDTACCLFHVAQTIAVHERRRTSSSATSESLNVGSFFTRTELHTKLTAMSEEFDSVESRWDYPSHSDLCQELFVLVASAGDSATDSRDTFARDWLPRARAARARHLHSSSGISRDAADNEWSDDELRSATSPSGEGTHYGPEGVLVCGDSGWSIHYSREYEKLCWKHRELDQTVWDEPREAYAYRMKTEAEGWRVCLCPSGKPFWNNSITGDKVWDEPECMKSRRHNYYNKRMRPLPPKSAPNETKVESQAGTPEGFVASLTDAEVQWWIDELVQRFEI